MRSTTQKLSARNSGKALKAVRVAKTTRRAVLTYAIVAEPRLRPSAEPLEPELNRELPPVTPMSYDEVLKRPDNVPALQLLEAERTAKEVAETDIVMLQSRIAEAEREMEAQSQEFAKAEEAWRKVTSANFLNRLLNKQLQDEIDKAAAAKDLASARYKELQKTTAALREQEKLLMKARKDAERAQAEAKTARAALSSTTAANQVLRQQAQAEAQRASAAVSQTASLQDALARMQQVERQLKSAVSDARRIQSLRDTLSKTRSLNQVLRRQVLAEGARASRAASEIAKYQALARDEEKLRQQVSLERKTKEAAQLAFERAAAELEAEKLRVSTMMAEAIPTLELIQSEQTARTSAEEAVKSLETKLMDATHRLEYQSKVIAESATVVKSAAISQEALGRATSTIEMLKQQLAGEKAKVEEAKQQAASRSKALAAATAKLRETLAAQERGNADFLAATSQSEADKSALLTVSTANDTLRKQIAVDARRADRAEKTANVLAYELKEARAYGEQVSAQLAAVQNMDHVLTEVTSENDVLRKIVKAENDRAMECEKEIVVAKKRITKAEKMMPVLQAEIAGLKDTMESLKLQMQRILASKPAMEAERESKLDAMLESTAAELAKSQQGVAAARSEAAKLRESLRETNSKVSELEKAVVKGDSPVKVESVELVVA